MRSRLVSLIYRLLAALRRGRLERDLDDELAFHLAMKADDYVREGVDDPHASARRRFGNAARLREDVRDMWTFPALESVWADLRFAARRLAKDRGFTLVAVMALALGIGANSTFFALVHAICLRGLPIDEPERVMFIASRDRADRPGGLSYDEFSDLRGASTRFEGLAAMTLAPMTIGDVDRAPDRLLGAYISSGAFDILPETPIAGRGFLPQDDRPGATTVALLGGNVWRSRYAGDPGILGRTVTVNGRPVTIVGVMREGFRFPGTADIWLPLATLPGVDAQPREARSLSVFGRLKDGVERPLADAELTAIRAAWSKDFPAAGRDVRTTIAPINEQYNPSVTQQQWIAFIVAGLLVLLIACANVANLLLMRGVSRAREMAVRASIGGTRARIARQLLIEGTVLAAWASIVGMAFAQGGLRALSTLLPADALPYWMTFTLDYRIVTALVVVNLATVLFFGLVPAMQLSQTDPARSLTGGGRSGTRGVAARRWMASFLAIECALTLVLLAMVVVVARHGLAAARTELRVDGKGLLTMWLTLPRQTYETAEARAAFYARLEERLGGIGGGVTAGLTTALPADGGGVQDVTLRWWTMPESALTIAVNPQFFEAVGIPVRGTGFTADSSGGMLDTAVVNERFVSLFLRDREPVGEHVRVGASEEGRWLRIVGVVPTIRQRTRTDPDPVVYIPLRAGAPSTAAIVARTAGDPVSLSAPLRTLLAEMDPNLALYRVMTLDRAMHEAQWNGRIAGVLLRTLAAIGAVLALVGLYAVTGHAVGQRRRELAVLAALGARPRELRRVVLRPTIVQLAGGLALGVGSAYLLDPLFNGVDQPIAMTDAATLGPLIAAVFVVAVAACLIPAREAARADPIAALRLE